VADHGEALDEHLDQLGYAFDHGELLDSASIFVPLVVAGPGVEPGRSASAVSIRDLYPTFLATAGIEQPDAADEDRRDLRAASVARRLVWVERRSLIPGERKMVGPEAIALMKTQEVAVSDGTRTLILDSEGRVTSSGETAPDLVAAGRARLERLGGRSGGTQKIEVDSETEEALRGLGYIQ
jgi:arylsulfatase A-like enzyme